VPKSHCLYVPVLFALLAISPTSAEDLSDCPQLLYYADNQLEQEWRAATLKAARAEDSLALMKQARRELLDVGFREAWARTRGPELAHAIHTVCNAIENVVSIGTGGKLHQTSMKFSGMATGTQADFAALLEAKGALDDLFTYQSEVAAGKILLSQVPYLGGAINLFADFANDLENQKYVRKSGDELRATVSGYLDNIDSKLATYHTALTKSAESIEAREAIGRAIEERCGWLRDGSARKPPRNPTAVPNMESAGSQTGSASSSGWYIYTYEDRVLKPNSTRYGEIAERRMRFMDLSQCRKSYQIKYDELVYVRSASREQISRSWELQEQEHTLLTLTECKQGSF